MSESGGKMRVELNEEREELSENPANSSQKVEITERLESAIFEKVTKVMELKCHFDLRSLVDDGDVIAFRPNRVNINIGDKVVFEFLELNHSLTQSMIGQPCTPAQQLNSDFKNFNPTNRTGLTLSITVNSSNSQ
ncbi:hypothetical protein AJ78_08954 [Emergomyces pasteurianus Ep9510]|uniref:Uncharacterized protein n=1 Tax=Emergomyces pasteurianus Ep9510 TaxID=1447872 RepID=A0A1J9Q0E4_9EURO|nr:hypothetical protein AJ78_08954 [Emergomyces pasteurianus Ep9510]